MADYFNDYSQGYSGLGSGLGQSLGKSFSSGNGGYRRKSTGFSEDLDNSLLKMIGNKTVGGLSALGNVLDLPGSVARDVLAGENPIDQLISPFTGDNRTAGVDLLRKYGMAGKKDTWGNWAGGLAAEIVTDPTNWITLGGKTIAGKAAEKIGKLAKGVSPGIKQGQRALATFEVPLTNYTFGQVGTGPMSQKVAGAFDKAKDAARYSRPVRAAAQLLDARNMGLGTEAGQRMAPGIFDDLEKARQLETQYTLGTADKLDQAGKGTSDDMSVLRMMTEGIVPGSPANPAITAVADDLRKRFDDMIPVMKDYGFSDKQIQDQFADYTTRHRMGELGDKMSARTPMNMNNPKVRSRYDIFRDFKLGTEGVNQLVKDNAISSIIDSGLAAKRPRADIAKDVFAHIKSTYAGVIEPKYAALNRDGTPRLSKSGKPIMRDRYKGLAKYLVNKTTPEIRKQGLFGNVIADSHGYFTAMKQKQAVADTLYGYISKNAQDIVDADPKEWMTVKEFLKKGSPGLILAKEDATNGSVYGAIPKIMEMATGAKPIDVKDAYDFGNKVIPRSIGEDLTKAWEITKTPPELGWIADKYKKATNLFKAGVLTHPARYVRDLAGATFRNLEEGALGAPSSKILPKSMLEGMSLATGGTPSSLVDHPLVKDYLLKQGITSPTPDQASRAARILAASHLPSETIFSEAGDAAAKVDPTLESILGALPGRGYSGPGSVAKDIGKTFFNRRPDASYNPFNLRGVMGDETKFGPAKAGELAGDVADKMGRVPAFLELTRQGWDPHEAAKKIGSMQTNYAGRYYTPFENQWAKNLFPFYSFQKSQLGYTLDNLLQSQGGSRLGNIIKTTARNSSEDPYAPDHVKQSASIKLGDKPGDTASYLTSLGMMHEDPASLLGTIGSANVRGGLLEGISNLNPLIKMGAEWGLGRTAFQQGPRGGRDIEDLDPTLGRIAANISDTISGDRTRKVDPVGSSGFEFLLGNLPTSRWMTTARTLTDPRKNALEKAFNTLTGFRISDVSPGMRDRVKSEYADQLLEDLGARPFDVTQLNAEQEAKLSPEDLIRAKLLESIKAKISADQRARAKAN